MVFINTKNPICDDSFLGQFFKVHAPHTSKKDMEKDKRINVTELALCFEINFPTRMNQKMSACCLFYLLTASSGE